MASFILTRVSGGLVIPLSPGLNQVGRNPTNDARIHDATVSSFHCEINVSPDQVTVKDLCSTNGTYVDGQLVEEAPIAPGQILKLGSVELQLGVEQEIRVAIPTRPATPDTSLENVSPLPEGVMPCLIHRSRPGIYQCTKCNDYFCQECVREVGLKGAQVRRFCPTCSAPCIELELKTPPKKKVSFFGRLTQTIRIRRG